eukprot:scaffold26280_cov151-Skeletonema_menzelii.AAC.2
MGQNDCLDIVWDGSTVRIFVVCLELHTSAPIRHGVATSAGSFTLGMEVVIVHSPKAKAYDCSSAAQTNHALEPQDLGLSALPHPTSLILHIIA